MSDVINTDYAQDMTQALDTIDLRGCVKALREWHEGYEELQAIPHAFALEFTDGQGPWSFFCDSEEDKVQPLHPHFDVLFSDSS